RLSGASTPGERAERYITLAMLHLQSLRQRVSHQVSAEECRTPVFAELFAVLSTLEGTAEPESLAEELSEAANEELDRLLEAVNELESPNWLVDDRIRLLRLRALRDQTMQVHKMLLEETLHENKDVQLAEKIRI